jgi:hypothetical protein
MARCHDHLPAWLQPNGPHAALRVQAFGSNLQPTVLVPTPGPGRVLTAQVPGKCSATDSAMGRPTPRSQLLDAVYPRTPSSTSTA